MYDLLIGIPAAHRPPPPLAKVCYGGVMPRHFHIETPDFPTKLAQPQAKLRLFAGNERASISANRLECVRSNHGVTAACGRLSDRCVPFDIAEAIVNRGPRMTLAPSPTYDRDVAPSSEKFQTRLEPARYEFTIAVDKL